MLTLQEAEQLQARLPLMPLQEKIRILELLDEYEEKTGVHEAQSSLLTFINHLNPEYMVGAHHRGLANLLEDVEKGVEDRIAVSIAPRMGKSYLISFYYPAWYLGLHPTHSVIIASHKAEIAEDFSRKVRNLIASEPYQRIFPETRISADSKSAGRWHTTKGGEFFAIGVGSGVAGRGGHLILVDDPFNEQDVLNGNYDVFEKAYQWFTYGLRTRMMKGGKIAIVHTRWHQSDLIGRLTKDMVLNPKADQYHIVEYPAVLDVESVDDENNKVITQKALWPEMWPLEVLERTKNSMPTFQWNAQYMQNPTGEEAAIVKRDWWQWWEKEEPPDCEFTIQSWDTAFLTTERADYSACITAGVFRDKEQRPHVIILNSHKDKYEFPELKKAAFESFKRWKPDSIVVEAKASGHPLISEMRRAGIPVQEFVPSKGRDKVARLHSVADMLSSGQVWVPQTRWAEELVEEVASFPVGEHDDLVDALTALLLRVRNGGLISLPSDEEDSDEEAELNRYYASKRRYYY